MVAVRVVDDVDDLAGGQRALTFTLATIECVDPAPAVAAVLLTRQMAALAGDREGLGHEVRGARAVRHQRFEQLPLVFDQQRLVDLGLDLLVVVELLGVEGQRPLGPGVLGEQGLVLLALQHLVREDALEQGDQALVDALEGVPFGLHVEVEEARHDPVDGLGNLLPQGGQLVRWASAALSKRPHGALVGEELGG